jgi:hypothetical protein
MRLLAKLLMCFSLLAVLAAVAEVIKLAAAVVVLAGIMK